VVGGEVNRRLLPWIRQHCGESFFLFVHYWDPHLPYNQPDEYARPFAHERGSLEDIEVREAPAGYRYIPGWATVDRLADAEGPPDFEPEPDSPMRHPQSIDSYDGEIRYTDFLIEEVLSVLEEEGILNDTAVVVNADHGEQLNQHYGIWGHPGLHDANVFTPLVLWSPGLFAAKTRPRGFVHHIDLAPTILDLLGIESDMPMDGRSLLPLIRGEAEPRERYFAESMVVRSIQQQGWKLIWHKCAQDELYNVEADPLEQINLIDEEPEMAQGLMAELETWVEDNLGGKAGALAGRHAGRRADPMLYQLARTEELRGRPHRFY
jgi:arylsulfatase A-like enzyme